MIINGVEVTFISAPANIVAAKYINGYQFAHDGYEYGAMSLSQTDDMTDTEAKAKAATEELYENETDVHL